jgi:membrane protease YdiL (CAAX protease family)
MELAQHPFIKQSTNGRNPWWSYLGMAAITLFIFVVMNQLINRLIIPLLRDSPLFELVGKDNLTYVMIISIFAASTLAITLGQRILHQRTMCSLINNVESRFRWNLYFSGVGMWGLILFIMSCLTEFDLLMRFIDSFNFLVFLVSFLLASIGLFIQTLWEELLFRGYLLQNIGRKFSFSLVPNIIISVFFAFFHFGYGIESFLMSGIYSAIFIILTLKDGGIERVAGMHFINNLMLLMVFVDVSEVTNPTFQWGIDWFSFGLFIVACILLLKWCGALPSIKALRTAQLNYQSR